MLGTIRWKIILYSVVPVTLLYNLIFCIYFYMTYEDITGEVEARIQHDVMSFSRAIDSEISNIMQLAGIIAQQYQEMSSPYEKPVLDAIVGAKLLRNPLISSVVLYELQPDSQELKGQGYFLRQGKRLQWSGLLEETNPISKMIKQPAKNLPGISSWTPLYKDSLTGYKVTSCLLAIMVSGQLWGYLSFDINIQQLVGKVLDRHPVGDYPISDIGALNLVDRQGRYLYTTDKKAVQFGYRNLSETSHAYRIQGLGGDIGRLIDKGESARDVMFTESGFKREYWFFGSPVKATDWWLFAYISRDQALSSGYSSILSNAIILAISLLLITACSWFASLKITQPVLALKRAMDVFTYKNKVPEISVNSSDEIGSLADSFQQLLEKLNDRDQALHAARTNNIGHLVQKLGGTYFYFNLDRDGCITHVSLSIEAILGYTVAEFCRPFSRFISGSQNLDRYNKQIHSVLSGEWSEPFELDLCHKDGSGRRIEIFWSHMGGNNGNYSTIEGLANDVTERVSDTEKFKGLLDSGPDATIIATTEGIISLVNSRAEELFGYGREELVNMPLRLLAPVDIRELHPLLGDLATASWAELCLAEYESRGIDANGRVFPLEITSNPLETNEGLLISIVARDITSRKKIEQELRSAKEQAEKASMAKGMFLSNMSHELRTPLNGVLGYTQVLLRDGEMPVKHHKWLKAIESSGYHLLSVINDILDLTKIELGEVELHMHPCNLKQMLRDVQAMLVERADSKGLELEVNYLPDLPEVVIVDEIKVRQVLLNLLSNAVKYTLNGWVRLSVSNKGEHLLFLIEDSGVGIAEEDLERIFEPFRQLKPGLEGGGTGLGLSISRWLVACMGGCLTVTSQVGKGTTFSFDLPLKTVKADTSVIKNRRLSGYQHLEIQDSEEAPLILVVDDIESNRDMMAGLLSGAGFRVEMACNGLEAVTAVSSGYYDLVLMDIKMPVLNGVEAIKKIREMESGQDLPVIAVTASVSEETKKKLLAQGFNGYVGKPFDANHLFELIEQHLDIIFAERSSSDSAYIDECECSALIDGLKGNQKAALAAILSEALELGDLELLENKLAMVSSGPRSAPLIKLIMSLCLDMNLEKLEEMTRKLSC